MFRKYSNIDHSPAQGIIYLSREDSHFCKVSNNKSFSVGVQSPTEINAPRECAVILRRICQLSLTRITHQVSRAFDLNSSSGSKKQKSPPVRMNLWWHAYFLLKAL